MSSGRRSAFTAGITALACIIFFLPLHTAASVDRNSAAPRARKLLRKIGDRDGLIVHVGCDNGRLTAELCGSWPGVVQGLDTDRADVRKTRRYLRSGGLDDQAGARTWNGRRLPYVDNLVNVLVVSEAAEVREKDMMRVLAPRGTALLEKDGQWVKKSHSWPPEIDEWTHWLHDPSGNAVSSDRRVGVSRSLQWTMPPRWTRHHNLPAGFNGLVSGDGRIYYLVDEAPRATYGPGKWMLVARDAFNGVELWRKSIREWGMKAWGAEKRFGGRVGRFHGAPDFQAPRRLIAADGELLVTLGFHAPVSMLDGSTGRRLQTYPQTRNTGEMLYRNGTLYVAKNTYGEDPGKAIMAVETDTGATLWERTGYSGVVVADDYQRKHTSAYLTLGAENLFFVDGDRIVALDARTGRTAWTNPVPQQEEVKGDIRYFYSNLCTLVYRSGMLYFAQTPPGRGHMTEWEMKKIFLQARRADTGDLQWEHTGGTLAHVTSPDLFVRGDHVWTFDSSMKANGNYDARLLGLDRLSGKQELAHRLEKFTHGHHHRCYRNKATSRYMLTGEEGIEYVDFSTGNKDIHYWVRGACRYGIMPANGFIYVTPHNCACYQGTLLHGFRAMKSTPTPVKDPGAERVVQGEAHGQSMDEAAAAKQDWPLFRGDTKRSCFAPVELPDELSTRWTATPGGAVSPPIVVGSRVFVASPERNTVTCLKGDTGEVAWKFTADGPINSPPTYWKGRILFGTRTGSLYSLTADAGKLVWRQRVAPGTSQLMAFGQLESPWPLNGSPVVLNGSVYCIAGRSMHLDSGLYAARVDARSGRLLQRTNLQADTAPKGEVQGAVLPDMLVSDGDNLYMKWMQFEPEDITQHELTGRVARKGKPNKPADILTCTTEMTDDSWLNTCFWSYQNCSAQQMAFDGSVVCGANGPGAGGWRGAFGHDVHHPGKGHTVTQWRVTEEGRTKDWNRAVQLRPSAMLLSRKRLYLAGPPDEKSAEDFWAPLQGKEGGLLQVISREDGENLAHHRLDSPPVYNGMATTGDALYISLENGSVVCFDATSQVADSHQ